MFNFFDFSLLIYSPGPVNFPIHPPISPVVAIAPAAFAKATLESETPLGPRSFSGADVSSGTAVITTITPTSAQYAHEVAEWPPPKPMVSALDFKVHSYLDITRAYVLHPLLHARTSFFGTSHLIETFPTVSIIDSPLQKVCCAP
jgi:hypothetical protein